MRSSTKKEKSAKEIARDIGKGLCEATLIWAGGSAGSKLVEGAGKTAARMGRLTGKQIAKIGAEPFCESIVRRIHPYTQAEREAIRLRRREEAHEWAEKKGISLKKHADKKLESKALWDKARENHDPSEPRREAMRRDRNNSPSMQKQSPKATPENRDNKTTHSRNIDDAIQQDLARKLKKIDAWAEEDRAAPIRREATRAEGKVLWKQARENQDPSEARKEAMRQDRERAAAKQKQAQSTVPKGHDADAARGHGKVNIPEGGI